MAKHNKKTTKKKPKKRSKKTVKKNIEQPSPLHVLPDSEFYKKRASVGRPRLFEDPKSLAQAFLEYTSHVDSNPQIEEDFVGGGFNAGQKVFLHRKRPYTINGFCIFIDAHQDWWNEFKRRLKKDDPRDKEFSGVMARIEQVCYSQKFDGAAAGFFNANIISRDLGLKDSTETTNITYASVDLLPDQIKKIAKELDENY